MTTPSPAVVVLAGPNGAGKSTAAPGLLQGVLGVTEFVNADAIAAGLSPFNSEAAALTAGRVMLDRLHSLARQRESFAFETTLASRSFAPWLVGLSEDGYKVHVVFLWLSSAELALRRVSERVAAGGHNVPETVIRRRYRAGVRNFFQLYVPVASTWRVYNASGLKPTLVTEQLETGPVRVYDRNQWDLILGQHTP